MLARLPGQAGQKHLVGVGAHPEAALEGEGAASHGLVISHLADRAVQAETAAGGKQNLAQVAYGSTQAIRTKSSGGQRDSYFTTIGM